MVDMVEAEDVAVEIIVEMDVMVEMVVVVEVVTTVTNFFVLTMGDIDILMFVLTMGDIDILMKFAGSFMVDQWWIFA